MWLQKKKRTSIILQIIIFIIFMSVIGSFIDDDKTNYGNNYESNRKKEIRKYNEKIIDAEFDRQEKGYKAKEMRLLYEHN